MTIGIWVLGDQLNADQAALARRRPDNPAVAARFELVVNGLEIANGYHELADPREQRARFEHDPAQAREAGVARRVAMVTGLGHVFISESPKARVLRLALAQLGVRRPIVLGHSYGGSVAMGFALENENQTAGVVLLAGATHPWDGGLGGWYRLNATPLGRPARASVAAFAPETMVAEVLDSVFSPTQVPEGYDEYFGPNLSIRRASQANNTRQVNSLHDYVTVMQPEYADLTLPIEILHGDADTIVGLEIHSRRMAAEAPGAVLTVLTGAGHMPQHSHPEAVVAAIARAAQRAGL